MQKKEISRRMRINKFLKTIEKQPEKANTLLKPQVVIHRPEEKELPLFKEIEKPITTEQKEEFPDEEMLYEVERVEVEEVKFLEVEPKEITKREDKISIFKKIEGGKIFGEPDVEEELSEWEPLEPTVSESEIPKKEEEIVQYEEIPQIKEETKIKIFNEIKSIDKKIAILIYDNGFTSVDSIRAASLKDLTKIKGIKKGIAKKIKKEINELLETKKSHDTKEAQSLKQEDVQSFRHGEYALYRKEIETGAGEQRIVHFFSKTTPDEGKPVKLPPGYEVKVNKKTGIPYLKKSK